MKLFLRCLLHFTKAQVAVRGFENLYKSTGLFYKCPITYFIVENIDKNQQRNIPTLMI